MAGIPVNNNLNTFGPVVNRAVGMKQEEAPKDSFDVVMNRVNSQTKAPAAVKTAAGNRMMSSNTAAESVKQSTAGNEKPACAETDKSAETDHKVSDAEQNVETEGQPAADKTEAAENPSETGMTEEQKDAMSEAGEKLVEEVAEEMGVTPEEVLEAMEMLGLSMIQLLDPDNMKQLLMAISGSEDQLSIITDGELYAHLQNLLNTVSEGLNELQTELGLSEEELRALIAQAAEEGNEPEAPAVPEELMTDPEKPEMSEGMKDYAVTIHRDGEEVKVKVQVDDGGANKSVREEVTQTSEVQGRHETGPDNREAFGENRGEGSTQNHFMMQTPVEQPVTNETAAAQTAVEHFTSTEDIMNQITEYIRINLRGDVQEMELQLHPASLGSVNVQIAAKDGVITAQFTAQNETVKAAIESQLVQLKTQFEEQGIKVEAVEVTVANYRFEQNFSGKEENAGEGKNGKKGPRRINLNDMGVEELPEDLEDSDKIAADMMARSGNTVDYTA